MKEIPIIIYEGAENSGKTTIKRIVSEEIQHNSLSFERWTGTTFAYGTLFERSVLSFEDLLEMDKRMDSAFQVLLVYLEASYKKISERINSDPMKDKRYRLNFSQYGRLLEFFNLWYNRTPFRNKIRYSTDDQSPEEIAIDISLALCSSFPKAFKVTAT